jgi:energy-converting hydrogenase Eha subunit C
MPFNLTGKIHDLIATLTAGSVVAVALSDLDVALKIVVGALTSVFLLLGIVIRARDLRSGGGGKKGEGE